MTNIDRAFDIENGLNIEGGAFITSGTASPDGLDLPELTFYIQTTGTGHVIWKKFGAGVNDWRELSAEDIRAIDTGEDPSIVSDIQTLLTNLLSGNTPSVSQTLYFGDGGNTSSNSYLSNNGVKSNIVGVPVGLTNPKLRSIFLGNLNTRTGDVLIQERFPQGTGTWTTIRTLTLSNEKYHTDTGLDVAFTSGSEVAVFTEVSLKSVKVVININGESV